jgi:hypothetical protein
MLLAAAVSPPLLTPDLRGLGGRIKVLPEDFDVEEIPAYPPSGTGDFLYLWIEKRDMGAEYFIRQIAKRLDIPAGEVGTAGMKDRRAVARQMVSVPGHLENHLPQLEGDGIRLLAVSRHENKLRPGHLHGNRFRVLVRDLDPNIHVAGALHRPGAAAEGTADHGRGTKAQRPQSLFEKAGTICRPIRVVQPLPRQAFDGRPDAHGASGRRDGQGSIRRPVRGGGYGHGTKAF